MLTLPEDWRSFPGGAIAFDLFQQVAELAPQREFARNLIGADLDLAIAQIFKDKCAPPLLETPAEFRWQIKDFTWVYLPHIDNDALAKAIALASHSRTVTLIVPPNHDEVLRQACQPTLKRRSSPVQSLDSLIALRVLFTSMALNCAHEEVVIDLLRRYNRRVVETGGDDAMLVGIS